MLERVEQTGTTAEASAALDAVLHAIADAAAVLDALLPRLSDPQRWQVVSLVGDVGRGADSLKLRIADDLIRTDDVPREERFSAFCGYRDRAEMLATELGASRFSTRRLLQAAKQFRPSVTITGETVPARFPLLGAALDRGAVSIEQASAIVEGLGDAPDRAHPDDLTAAEAALVDHASGYRGQHEADSGVVERPMPPEMLAKVARAWRDALDPDGVEPTYEEQLRKRDFRFGTRSDGMIAGSFVCTPDQGPALAAAFDAFTRPKAPRFKGDDEPATAELDTAWADGDDRTRGQRMVDAFVAMVARSVEGRHVPRVGGEAPTVVLHVQKSAVDAAAAGVPGCTATVERTGETVPVHIAAAIMCDGHIQTVVVGADGEPLELGRRKRYFTRAQRRALAARDGGCRAPGCDFPVGWTDAHHIRPWSEGGLTDLANGILLCKHHHQEVHRGALEIVWGQSGWVVRPMLRAPQRRRGWSVLTDPARLYPQRAA